MLLHCGQEWQPRSLDRVIETLPTSTRVSRVATNAGDAFVKSIGNPAGDDALASELVCAELARWYGLSTPDFAIVMVEDLRPTLLDAGIARPGPAFASRAVRGTVADGPKLLLSKLRNPADVSRLVFFDTWVRNEDRCPPAAALDPSPRYDNLFFRLDGSRYELMAIDHTHCFVGDSLEDSLGNADISIDPDVFGLFPEFGPLLREPDIREAASALARIDPPTADAIVASVPTPWGPSAASRRAWVDLIVRRGHFVAETLPPKLLKQLGLAV